MNRERKIHLDFLRIIACFFVIYNHTSKELFLPEDWCYSKTNYTSLIVYFFCKTAVPLFLMISGANLLKRTDSLSKHLHRILRIVVITVFISVIYCIYYKFPIRFDSIISHIYSDFTSTALWYLYLYISILIMLPLLQHLQLQKIHYVYLFFIAVFGQGLFPYLNYYYGLPIPQSYLTSALFPTYLILFLLGDGIENHLAETDYSLKHALLALITAIIALLSSLIPAIRQIGMIGEFHTSFIYDKIYFFPTLLLSCSIFYLIKFYFRNKNGMPSIIKKAIKLCGNCTFIIYLTGDFLIDFFKQLLIHLKVHMEINDFISTILFDIFVFLTGMLIALLLKGLYKIYTLCFTR